MLKRLNKSTVLFSSDETQSEIDPNLGPIESDHEDNTPPIDNMVRVLLQPGVHLNCYLPHINWGEGCLRKIVTAFLL